MNDMLESSAVVKKLNRSSEKNKKFEDSYHNSSAPRSKQTSFVIDIFSKSEGCVQKYSKKFCLG